MLILKYFSFKKIHTCGNTKLSKQASQIPNRLNGLFAAGQLIIQNGVTYATSEVIRETQAHIQQTQNFGGSALCKLLQGAYSSPAIKIAIKIYVKTKLIFRIKTSGKILKPIKRSAWIRQCFVVNYQYYKYRFISTVIK